MTEAKDDAYVEYAELATISMMGILAFGTVALLGFVEYMTAGMGLFDITGTPSGAVVIDAGSADPVYVIGVAVVAVLAATVAIAFHSALRVVDERHPGAELPY